MRTEAKEVVRSTADLRRRKRERGTETKEERCRKSRRLVGSKKAAKRV